MERNFDPLALADVAAEQWGLITTAQAEQIGATAQRVARMANAGILERLRHGIYRLTGAPAHPYDDIRAAWLALDPARTAAERLDDEHPGGVISHRTAALLHGLGDLDADLTDIMVPSRRRSRAHDVRFHTGRLTPDQWTVVDGLPVATVAATVGQLAAAHTDGGHLAGVVRDTLTEARISPGELAAALRPYAHRYGAPLGDGDGVIQLFLDQAGVPASTVVAAAGRSAEISRAINSLGIDRATLNALAHGQDLGGIRETMDRFKALMPGIDPAILAAVARNQETTRPARELMDRLKALMPRIDPAILAAATRNEEFGQATRAIRDSITVPQTIDTAPSLKSTASTHTGRKQIDAGPVERSDGQQ